MDTHKNGPLTAKGREAMVCAIVEGWVSQAAAARQFNVTPKTVAKWVLRFRAEGWPACRTVRLGLAHRRAKPRRPHALGSRLCVGNAVQASKSPPKSGVRRQPSAAFSSASASIGCRRWSRLSQSAVMSGPPLARSSTFRGRAAERVTLELGRAASTRSATPLRKRLRPNVGPASTDRSATSRMKVAGLLICVPPAPAKTPRYAS